MPRTKYHNGQILTLNSSGDRLLKFNSFVVENGIITQVGNDQDTLSIHNDATVDLHNKIVLPGLHDSHLHLHSSGEDLTCLNLKDTKSRAEFVSRFEKYLDARMASQTPNETIIFGYGWEQDILGFMPTFQDLDDVLLSDKYKPYFENTPVFVARICFHIGVVNTKLMEICQIDLEYAKKFNENPESGGTVDICPETGKLTGILREDALKPAEALRFVDKSPEIFKQEIVLFLNQLAKFGVTCAHGCEESYAVWKEIYNSENDLAKNLIRVENSLYFSYFVQMHDQDKILTGQFYENPSHPKYSMTRVKIFTDGALGAKTAALSKHYLNCNHKDCGIAIENEKSLTEKIRFCYDRNFAVEIHVIGDLAAEFAVNAVIQNDAIRVAKNLPNVILIHCQLLKPELITKMAEYKILASVQPSFVPTDCRWLDSILTPEYMEEIDLYAWKKMLDSNVLVAGGSDSPVELANPLIGMYDCIFRPKDKISKLSHAEVAKDPFLKDQCLSFIEALRIYTFNAVKFVPKNNSKNLGIIGENSVADGHTRRKDA